MTFKSSIITALLLIRFLSLPTLVLSLTITDQNVTLQERDDYAYIAAFQTSKGAHITFSFHATVLSSQGGLYFSMCPREFTRSYPNLDSEATTDKEFYMDPYPFISKRCNVSAAKAFLENITCAGNENMFERPGTGQVGSEVEFQVEVVAPKTQLYFFYLTRCGEAGATGLVNVSVINVNPLTGKPSQLPAGEIWHPYIYPAAAVLWLLSCSIWFLNLCKEAGYWRSICSSYPSVYFLLSTVCASRAVWCSFMALYYNEYNDYGYPKEHWQLGQYICVGFGVFCSFVLQMAVSKGCCITRKRLTPIEGRTIFGEYNKRYFACPMLKSCL
jgi:hypothetical protein